LQRERMTARLEAGLAGIEGISLLPRDPRITRQASYHYVFKYHPEAFPGIHRDAFVVALKAEGIPCDGRFYEAVYRSSLFEFAAEKFLPGRQAGDSIPVRTRNGQAMKSLSGYRTRSSLAQMRSVDDLVTAIGKVVANIGELAALTMSESGFRVCRAPSVRC
jgi:hypothetical protein